MKACIDIGGTKVAVSLNSGAGLELLARRSEPTAKTGINDALARQVIRMVDEACAETGDRPCHGGAVPASPPADLSSARWHGRSGRAQHLRRHRRARARPAQRLEDRVAGGAAARALRARCGWRTTASPPWRPSAAGARLQGFDHCAYVTWSTGIGVGLCVDGRMLRGKNGNAGHAGHMFVSDNDDALVRLRQYRRRRGAGGGQRARAAFRRRRGHACCTRAKAGDAGAQAMVDELCRVMGRALYNLIATLDLQRISLGGGVFWNNSDYLLPRLRRRSPGNFPALTAGSELVTRRAGATGWATTRRWRCWRSSFRSAKLSPRSAAGGQLCPPPAPAPCGSSRRSWAPRSAACCASRGDFMRGHGLRRGQCGQQARPLRIWFFLQAQPAARVAFARQQHLIEALRLAKRIAALQQPHQRRSARIRRCGGCSRAPAPPRRPARGIPSARASGRRPCAADATLRSSWPMCLGSISAGVVPLPRSCVRQAKRTGSGASQARAHVQHHHQVHAGVDLGVIVGALRHAPEAIDLGQQARQRAALAQHFEHARGLGFHQPA